jgi:hypothetical protein
MQNSLPSKGVAVGVVLVFIGVAIAPSIHFTIVKASDDNELVEVTTQVCSVHRDIDHTIHLTKQQVREVQRVFDTLKNRMSTAESMDETRRIFNDTIVVLSRYNLLPNGMSIEQTKRLVTGAGQNQKVVTLLQKISTKFQANSKEGALQNSFCLIAGNTSNTHFAKPITKIAMRLFDNMDYNTENHIIVVISTVLWIVLNPFTTISQMMLKLQGNHYGVSIFFGNFHYYPYPNWLYPAQGWLSTNGINGIQNISGSFWGQKITSGWQPQDDWYMNYTWRGCVGFTGFITHFGSDSAYYLGSALHVNVGADRP